MLAATGGVRVSGDAAIDRPRLHSLTAYNIERSSLQSRDSIHVVVVGLPLGGALLRLLFRLHRASRRREGGTDTEVPSWKCQGGPSAKCQVPVESGRVGEW
jgi:hypothetical protein